MSANRAGVVALDQIGKARWKRLVLPFSPCGRRKGARRAGELQHALPKQSFYAVHAEPKQFFEPADFSELLADPHIIGLHISPKGRGGETPIPGSLYAWAAEKFGK